MTTLKTYRAPTMAQALAEVKKDLGSEAVIVNTRSIKAGGWAGLGARAIVEITASPASAPPSRAAQPQRPTSQLKAAPTVKTVVARASASAPPAPQPQQRRPEPAARAAAIDQDWSPLEFSQLMGDTEAAERSWKPVEIKAPPARAEVNPAPVIAQSEPTAPIRTPAAKPQVVAPGEIAKIEIAPPPPEVATPPAQAPARGPARLAVKAPLAPVSDAARASLEEELSSIKRLMGQVLQFSRRAAIRGESPLASGMPIPPVGGVTEVLREAYSALLDAAIAPELADRLLAGVQGELETPELEDPDLVRRTLARLLAEAIPVVRSPGKPGRQPDGRPLTIALVGPTGVGKTTTIAKLAAMYKLRHGKRVGLLTTDTYRIAAVEQLRTYARIIGLPIKVAADAQDLAEGMEEMKDMDVVLIDTAGRSPTDQARLDELSASVRAARPHETHLVLAATATEAVLMRTAERFRALEPDRLLLTKLDEAVQLGVIASVPARAGLPVSYITTGQEVPDDLELASADRLARRVIPGILMDSPITEAVGA
ncbi:MAG: flagellar biosynthesis protein FlhF [Phycisphaerales bacterium]|nr:flagellar biosynthesis protein FlhF [Phycisphaerales bacterium]